MAALTAAILAISASNTVNSFIGQRRAAKAAEAQGNAEGSLFDINAQLAQAQAADAIARGEQQASQVERGARELGGAQRAALAADGVDVNSGSALDVQRSDRRLADVDMATIRNNAKRQAWGFTTEAAGYRLQGDFARTAGRNAAAALRTQSVGTLLNGIGSLADSWNAMPHAPSRAPIDVSGAQNYVSSIDTSQISIPRFNP